MNKTSTFTDLALRTESRPEVLQNLSPGTVYDLLRMMVVAGEVIDTAKRAIFYGKPLDDGTYRQRLSTLSDMASDLFDKSHGRLPQGDGYEPVNLRLLHATLGIFGESGELAEALVNQMTIGELDMVNVSEELGDVDWYKQIGHDETGVGEVDVRAKIIAKLMKRYPDKFDSDAALNRDLAAERAVLETTTA